MLLNAYPMTVTGHVALWRFTDDDGRRRREMEARVGVELWADRGHYWAVAEPQGVDAEHVTVAISRLDNVVMFATRAAFVDHAKGLGCEAWTAYGEVHCVGLRPSVHVGSFNVTKELIARVVHEEHAGATPWLVARRSHRWTWAGSLADPDLWPAATGAAAIRLAGEGPPRGRVITVTDDELVIEARGEEVHVAARDYTVKATSALVSRIGGTTVLQRMLVASGSLNTQNRKNGNAVRDRFDSVKDLLDAFGRTVVLPGGKGERRRPRCRVATGRSRSRS